MWALVDGPTQSRSLVGWVSPSSMYRTLPLSSAALCRGHWASMCLFPPVVAARDACPQKNPATGERTQRHRNAPMKCPCLCYIEAQGLRKVGRVLPCWFPAFSGPAGLPLASCLSNASSWASVPLPVQIFERCNASRNILCLVHQAMECIL